MEALISWTLGIVGAIGWILFGKSVYDKRAWQIERQQMKEEITSLHELHRDNLDEIRQLKREIAAIQAERARFNERMQKVDKLFDKLGYSEDETD